MAPRKKIDPPPDPDRFWKHDFFVKIHYGYHSTIGFVFFKSTKKEIMAYFGTHPQGEAMTEIEIIKVETIDGVVHLNVIAKEEND